MRISSFFMKVYLFFPEGSENYTFSDSFLNDDQESDLKRSRKSVIFTFFEKLKLIKVPVWANQLRISLHIHNW